MAVRVKDTASVAAKFKARASGASNDYKVGVEGAAGEWEAKTRAAAPNYRDAVIEAAGRGAYEKGIAGAGARYQRRAAEVGPQRYTQGINSAQEDYARGVGPYLDEIRNMDLPARRPKGSPENMQRANAVAQRLRAKKLAM